MGKKLAVLVFVVSLLFSTFSSADVIKLKFANYFPPMHMNSIMMGKYCEELNKKLSGKVEITQYTGGTLLSPVKMAAGVASGIADFGLSHLSYTRGRFPVMEIMELPHGFPSPWIAGHVGNDFYNKYQPKDFDGFKVLMFSSAPINIIQTVNKPVRTLGDLKGLKLRGTGRIGDIVQAIGATPIPLEMPDLYDGLKRNLCEGALLSTETLEGFKTGELIKYLTPSWRIGCAYCFYVVMNKDKWSALPPDVQKVITDFSKEFIERWTVEWVNIDISALNYFKNKGGKVESIPEEDNPNWIKAVRPVIEDYKKDLASKGYKAAEIDEWISFVDKRILYWKSEEKARKIPLVYQY